MCSIVSVPDEMTVVIVCYAWGNSETLGYIYIHLDTNCAYGVISCLQLQTHARGHTNCAYQSFIIHHVHKET